ncbi:MAG: hypothetical protein KA354_20890 [Phycisphaerae bacterium]|nr:hypothetical protein [Phycisphaerae bacterium]
MSSRHVIFSLVVLSTSIVTAAPSTGTIQVRAIKPGPRIDPRLYGIFLEEINHGVDGGLYAELIRNRAFEDAKPPEGFVLKEGRWVDGQGNDGMGYDAGFPHAADSLPYWSLVQEGAAKGAMRLDMERPLNDVTPRCLRLQIEAVGDGRLCVANEGYWGIAAKEREQYHLSLYARCAEGFSGPLTATLEDAGGTACTTPVRITGIGADWKQFKVTLTATRTEPKCRFALAAGSKGVLWLDFVSLFPAKLFKDRSNGLRPDLAQMLADLKPGFVRFPGGCVVEGGTVPTAYNWKDTIGPLERRVEKWNVWNYRRTHGMGFLEYLQFCEDIGAEPLHVGFAGQTCLFRFAEHVPMNEMGWVRDNFLDAIEYANGDASTKWGELRADHGRERPFSLKMVEIGNENGMKEFPERYRFIQPAVKARYPGMLCIADLSWIGRDLMEGAKFDIEDNHFYNNPNWFMSNQDLYTRRDRKLPPVYVGEVAVTSEEGGPDKGNLLAALAEGAFLMGCERNADVVKMVSYAPLLAHVNGRTDWHGMIYFDSARCCGTASYHLWKLFALNRPDHSLETVVDFRPSSQPSITGAVGVGTWDTAAEYRDVRVEKDGKPLYASAFTQNADGWKPDGGRWAVAENSWQQSDPVVGMSYLGDESWSDYTLTLKARKLRGAEGFLVLFGRKGDEQYWWNLGGWGNHEHGIELNRSPVGRHVPGTIETGRWYDIKVELKGRQIRCYLDGKLIHDEAAPSTDRFFALAGHDKKAGELVIKVINTSPGPVATTLKIAGAGSISPSGRATVLRSARLDDNNSLDQPVRVAPSTKTIEGTSDTFAHEFPPFSLTILRIQVGHDEENR